VGTIVCVSLSPFDAEITTAAYRAAVEEAIASVPARALWAGDYHTADGYVACHADALSEAIAQSGERPAVVFTAHSLPCEEIDRDDAYVVQLGETVDAVARRAGLAAPGAYGGGPLGGAEAFGSSKGPVPWLVAYQSRGYRQCAWLEPDLEGVIDELAAAEHDGVVIAPVGFVTDHMETRYDLDIVARERAERLGIGFRRAAVPNAEPRMIDTFADAVLQVLPDPV
jgi:ferrochelatase